MAEFSSDWFSRNVAFWAALLSQAGWDPNTPKVVVEIGSFEGRATLWLLEHALVHPDSRIHCLDPFDNEIEAEPAKPVFERFSDNVLRSRHGHKVDVRRGRSQDSLLELLHEGVQADLVYLDGSHTAPDVLEDLVLSWRVLRNGGLLICDDYLFFEGARETRDILNSPKPAIDAFVNIYARQLQFFPGQPLYQLALAKRLPEG